MLDLQQLRYFVTVAETGNVGRAAKRLGMTQSPLSRQIQALEARLGLELFERRRKRLYLSRAGRDFLPDAQKLLADAEKAEARVHALSTGEIGTLVVGYVEGAVHAGVVPHSLQAFRREVPKASLELRSLRSGEQFAQLKSGEIDIGFTYCAPSVHEDLRSSRLFEEEFLLAFSLETTTAATPTVDDLNHAPFIALPENLSPGARQDFLDACARAGFRPEIRYEVAEPSIVLALVGAGLGVAIVQKSLRENAPEMIGFAPVPGAFSLRLSVYIVSSQAPNRLTEKFLEALAGDGRCRVKQEA